MRIVVTNSVTLDGVMQSPGHPDDDRREDSPFTAVLDQGTKDVASRTLTEPLEWQNSVLLGGKRTTTGVIIAVYDRA